jgi:hypothetical protein
MASCRCRCCSSVSEYLFERSVRVAAPAELAARFFAERETWFRLNPEWEVLEFADGQLKLRYERSEAEVVCRPASADFSATGGTVLFDTDPPRRIVLSWLPEGDGVTHLSYRETFAAPLEDARRAELNLWLDAAAGYLAIAARTDRKGKFMRWLLDRFWLRMSPTSRRVSLLIVGMEALALLLFIAVLIIYRLTA